MKQAWLENFSGQPAGYKQQSEPGLRLREKDISSMKTYFVSEVLRYHYCGAIDQVQKEKSSTTVYTLSNERRALQNFWRINPYH